MYWDFCLTLIVQQKDRPWSVSAPSNNQSVTPAQLSVTGQKLTLSDTSGSLNLSPAMCEQTLSTILHLKHNHKHTHPLQFNTSQAHASTVCRVISNNSWPVMHYQGMGEHFLVCSEWFTVCSPLDISPNCQDTWIKRAGAECSQPWWLHEPTWINYPLW